jgi:hypothetical protein
MRPRRGTACVAIAAAALVVAARPSEAQSPETPRFTVSFGAGMADPFHGDLEFNAASWDAAARGAASRHVLVEGFFNEWRHTAESVRVDLPIQGPTGVIGRIGRLSQRTQHTMQSVGVNVLPTMSRGRLTISAGGGGGFVLLQRHFTQMVSDCQSTGAGGCSSLDNRHTSSSLSVQGVVGVDVAITRRVLAFGQYRIVVPVDDAGSGHGAAVGGVRVVIR